VSVDHVLKFRPGMQEFEAKIECLVLKEKRDGPCLEKPYKTTCWIEELWSSVGIDALEKTEGVPWVMAPVTGRIEGYGDDAEGWIAPLPPEEVRNDNAVQVVREGHQPS
jgi:hypothetical protein